jgi:hypothetical protein
LQNILNIKQQCQALEFCELEPQLKEKKRRGAKKQLQNKEKKLELIEQQAKLYQRNNEMV